MSFRRIATIVVTLIIAGSGRLPGEETPTVEEHPIIHACAHKQTGQLRLVAEAGSCRNSEVEISWSVQGPPGEAGPEGPQGPAGRIPNAEVHELADLVGDPGLAEGLPADLVGRADCSASLRLSGLAGDDLRVLGLIGSEGVSRLSDVRIAVDGPPAAGWLGSAVAVHADDGGGSAVFSGIVTSVAEAARAGGDSVAVLEVGPALTGLGLSRDYRVFQTRTVPDLVSEIVMGSPQPVELRLGGFYAPSEMIVQYSETDLNFVSRLMEDAGLAYFFDTDGTMVITDDNSGFADDGASITFGDGANGARSFRRGIRLTAASATVMGFGFHAPGVPVRATVPTGGGEPEMAFFSQAIEDGSGAMQAADVELERALAMGEFGSGVSSSTDVRAGHILTIDDPAAGRFSGRYLVTAVLHVFTRDDSGCVGYGNTFRVSPADVRYRPPRTTPRPDIRGFQTALVAGSSDRVVEADEYGRVKVQFHWDRVGAGDENSSAFIRVAHPAGRTGTSPAYIPEVGDEVLVGFEQGDPSQPVIVGAMYNGDDRPPTSD